MMVFAMMIVGFIFAFAVVKAASIASKSCPSHSKTSQACDSNLARIFSEILKSVEPSIVIRLES